MPFILLVSLYFFNHRFLVHYLFSKSHRGGSRTAATSKMDRLVIIVNGWKLLTIITKCSILDVAAVLDPPLPHAERNIKSISHIVCFELLLCHQLKSFRNMYCISEIWTFLRGLLLLTFTTTYIYCK